VYPYVGGKVDWAELRNTSYHELIHLLLRDDIEEEDVEKMGDIINRRQKGWRFWCSYLSERAIALGLGPPDMADESVAVCATAEIGNTLIPGCPGVMDLTKGGAFVKK